MRADSPIHNFVTDFPSANATLCSILTLPFGNTDTSPSAGSAFDQLKYALASADISTTIPDHPKINLYGYSIRSNALSGKYSVDIPDLQVLVDLMVAISSTVLVGVLLATILYFTVLKGGKDISPIQKGMIGSALMLSTICYPYMLIDLFGSQNTAVRFSMCAPAALFIFRTLEAVFGYVPKGAVSTSLGVYCAYFSLPFDMMFDKDTSKPVMATKQDIISGHIYSLKASVVIIFLCSILSPSGFEPFGSTNAGEFNEPIDVREYLNWRHLGNCFAIAVYFQQALVAGDVVIGNIVQTALGYKVRHTMSNPMFKATSPSDFWGRRWNVLVHAVMKRGVYKPVAKRTSAAFAALAVFVASGLFHEWIIHAVFIYNRPSESTSGVQLGSNTAFFVWNFVVILVERLLSRTKSIRSFGRMIPQALVPFLIIMTSLPMAHWFGNPYLKGGYFPDYERLLPIFRRA